jgi:RNA polymerase sigma factor (sigma-70 family)
MADDALLSLIARAKKNDESAARELIEFTYPIVIRIVRNHLPRRELEEDLCQDVFLKIFSRLHQFRADMPFDHWVSRIAVNTCIDQLRKQKVRPEFRWSDFSEEQQAILDNLKNSAILPSAEEAKELVERLMQTLKPDERTVVTWLHLEEKSIAEICDLTGWTPSKVKVTAFRARQKLAAAVQRLEK